MTRPDPDWGFLRQGMLLPALCLLAGTLLWATTTIYRTRLDNALEAERQALAGIEQERQELISRREAREQFSAVYRRTHGQRHRWPRSAPAVGPGTPQQHQQPGPALCALLDRPAGSLYGAISHGRHQRTGDEQPDGAAAWPGARTGSAAPAGQARGISRAVPRASPASWSVWKATDRRKVTAPISPAAAS